MDGGRDLLSDAVAEALDGHCCASGWLGYANVLFLGFGDAPVPPRTDDGRRTGPPYEVNANRADWRIDGDGLAACADDDRGPAERAVAALIGRPVVGWSLGAGHALTVQFDRGLTVRVDPWLDPDEARWDAWSVSLPGRLVAVSCGGRVAAPDPECPVGQWFGGPAQTERGS
jgi:hypothetical protein